MGEKIPALQYAEEKMRNTFGNNITITLFGESHGAKIGTVIDGIEPGIKVDEEFIRAQLAKRRPAGKISTARVEADEFEIVSGVFNGLTTGTPVTILIPNADTRSRDYSATRFLARPGHADYTAFEKYRGFEDYRGGGHFSGRLTAPLVAAGAIALMALKEKNIFIGTHIRRCAGIDDAAFADAQYMQTAASGADNRAETTQKAFGAGNQTRTTEKVFGAGNQTGETETAFGAGNQTGETAEGELARQLQSLSERSFAVLDEAAGERMIKSIEQAALEKDSVGGILETAVIGLEAGCGDPWFDSVESMLSHAMFSIPAVKGIEFGAGFAMADMRGSQANDPFRSIDGKVVTLTNNNGGINGGISNGMPIIFRTVVKPTPSIAQKQRTVDFLNTKDADIEITGRHDPCIVHRACVVQDSLTALVIWDMLADRKNGNAIASNKTWEQ